MKHLYFVSNNLMNKVQVVYPKEVTFKEVREKTMLSPMGEKIALKLSKMKELEHVELIYSSIYFSALSTCKYIAEDKNLDILVDERLNERVVGELGSNEYRFLKGMQEHDFNYKLNQGESINEVKERMDGFLREILRSQEENILVVTHNIALLSLCLNWCNKGFNLDDRLILDYNEEVIFDGVFHNVDILEVVYEHGKFVGLNRLV